MTWWTQDGARHWPRPPLAHYHYVITWRNNQQVRGLYIETRLIQTAVHLPAGRGRNRQIRSCTLLSRNDSFRCSLVRPSNASPDLVACIRRASPRTDRHVTGSACNCLSTFKDVHVHRLAMLEALLISSSIPVVNLPMHFILFDFFRFIKRIKMHLCLL